MQRQPIGRRTSASAWLLITLLLPSLVACGSGISTAGLSGLDPATTTVTLRFRDSSVPPAYHRSYVLTVSEGQVHVVVDSYGDVLHDVTKPLPSDDWAKFVHGLGGQLAQLPQPERSSEGCAGGTGVEFTINDGSSDRVVLDVDNCLTGNEAVSAQLRDIMEPFASRVDLQVLASRGARVPQTTLPSPPTTRLPTPAPTPPPEPEGSD